MRPYPPLQQLCDELRTMHVGAVGLLDFINTDREFAVRLAALVPCVLLNKGLAGASLPCVTPDMFTAARLIVDYFADRGRKTVAAGVFNVLHQRHVELEIAIEGECLRRGLRVDRRLWQESDAFDLELGDAWIARLRREAHPPDALVLCSGTAMMAVESWMRDTGMTVGKDIDLVEFRQRRATTEHPLFPWPILRYDDRLASMTAMRMLFDIVEGKASVKESTVVRIPPELILPAEIEKKNGQRQAGLQGYRL